MNDSISPVTGPGGALQIRQPTMEREGAAAAATDVANEFGDLLQRSIDAIAKGEQVGTAGVVGSASTQEVVVAVMEAERSLQTALAVRNKVVEAYLEVSRMQI